MQRATPDVGLVWEKRLEEALGRRIQARTFAAFNANVDAIAHLDRATVERLVSDADVDLDEVNRRSILDVEAVRTKNDLLIVIRDRLSKGKSFHIVVESDEVLAWLEACLENPHRGMGGQAGIISNQMAHLGAPSIAYTPVLSAGQAAMFHPDVQTPTVEGDALHIKVVAEGMRPDAPTKINWILEYPEGLVLRFGKEEIVTPRANRVILATRPKEAVMAFSDELVPHLPELGEQIDVAFMAGYHYATPVGPDGRPFEAYLRESVEALRAIKLKNDRLRIHVEYVPMNAEELERPVLGSIAPEVNSLGINENEIKRLLTVFGFDAQYRAILDHERAYSLYKGALALLKRLKLDRLQVHNLGYYILVLRNPYVTPLEQVRTACLYASGVNSMKAKHGGYVTPEHLKEATEMPLSPIGFEQLHGLAHELSAEGIDAGAFARDGIAEFEDHALLIVPAHVVPNPVSTVGMGDTVSAASYAMEVFLA